MVSCPKGCSVLVLFFPSDHDISGREVGGPFSSIKPSTKRMYSLQSTSPIPTKLKAKPFVQRQHLYGIDLIAPMRADKKWQAKEKQGFDASSFAIDWHAPKARCPAGRESVSWTPAIANHSNEVIKIKFSSARLQALSAESTLYQSLASNHLSSSPRAPSSITRSASASKRRHILGDLSVQVCNSRGDFDIRVRTFGMRRSRYRGMQKTHFQHLMGAARINLVSALAWLEGQPPAQTRILALPL